LTQGGIAGYLSKLNAIFGFKAPLIAALPAPFYLAFGRRWHAAYLVNIAAMLVLFAALYHMAHRWWNRRAAIFAIAIIGAMPLLYGLVRWYLAEYVLTAFVAVAIALLIESESLSRRGATVLFGITCGFGLLLKTSFALFLLPPFLYTWMRSTNRIRSLLLSAIPCLGIALPWYVGHLRPTLANAFEAGYGAPASIQGTGAIFSVRAVSTYLARVAEGGVSTFYVILAVALAAFLARRAGPAPKIPRLLVYWFVPLAIFLFGGNKDIRYIAPILPAFALLTARLLDLALPHTKAANVLGALLVGFPIVQMFAVSFGVPYSAQQLVYAHRYSPHVWPLDQIVTAIAGDGPLSSAKPPILLVGSDRGSISANNVELSVVALHVPLSVETTAHEGDRNALFDRLRRAAFFMRMAASRNRRCSIRISQPLYRKCVAAGCLPKCRSLGVFPTAVYCASSNVPLPPVRQSSSSSISAASSRSQRM
jgi:hypothetical protein